MQHVLGIWFKISYKHYVDLRSFDLDGKFYKMKMVEYELLNLNCVRVISVKLHQVKFADIY